MTDQELLEIIKHVVKLARPVSADEMVIDNLDTLLKDTGLDSLDFLMVGIYISDIYGVSEEDVKTMEMNETSTIRDLFKFMQDHATKHPTTVKEALESIE
jgi:acyl carrier protein